MAKIWRFNDTVDVNRDNNFVVNFTSNGTNFTEIGFKWSTQEPPAPKDAMYYSSSTTLLDVYYNRWGGATPDTNPYRTITFETAPTGELLTWLQANAVAQDQPAVTTTRVLYKGKKELTMAQFEALTSLDDAVDYNITDFPNGGITNAQMTAALGYSRLFDDGEVFVCLDGGTYSKGHTYQVKVTNGVKSWEDITPESTPSTGTNIQVTELPPASAENVGKIVQFITARDYEGQEPAQGHWYKCQPVVADEGRYEWVKQLVQYKDYIVNTSNTYSSNTENVGRMVYSDPFRELYWIPYIALGELDQLLNYTQDITINYTVDSDGGETNKSQAMTYSAEDGYWIDETGKEFYTVSKAVEWFPSETLTKPLYMAVYQGSDLTKTSRKITVTSIDLANGTSITIPAGYGEAKFYNYSISAGYSSPIDFYNKFESGNLTDADIEAFRFMAVNQVDATFDINKLNIETENGLKPLKDYLGSPFKNSTFESIENSSSKEDTWKTTDPDTTLLMQHQNDNGQSGYSVSKNYTEMSSTLTTNGAITSTKLAVTNDTATMKSEDGAGNSKQFKMTPTEMLFSERPKVTTNGDANEDVAIKGDLQNYVPTQSELSGVALTWVINEKPDYQGEEDLSVTIPLIAGGNSYDGIEIEPSVKYPSPTCIIRVLNGEEIYNGTAFWPEFADRTLTFGTAPTGELLTWLQANAVPQGSSTKTYAQVTNENGAVSIRVFENGDADLQNLSITKDGVTINGKKPLTSIQPLYKHELVIPYSFSVTDPTNGTVTVNGSVMYHYLSNTGTQITSASAIDDNFLLSGGIGKNSANTVLLFDVSVTKAGSSITVEAVNASTMGYITGTVGTITDTVTQLI